MIIGMVAGIVVGGVLLVGVSLLAWSLGGQRFWRRFPSTSEPDALREMARRHGLSLDEVARVEDAVAWGRELTDPRLRAAVVDRGQALEREAAERRRRHPVAHLVGWSLLLLVVVLDVGRLVHGVWTEGWQGLLDLPLWSLLLIPAVLAMRAPRRAVRRNSEPVRS